MAGAKYADVPMGGIYLVRGENVVLVGEVVRCRGGRWCGGGWPHAPLARRATCVGSRMHVRPACCLQDEALDAANPHMVPVDLEVVRKEQEDAEEAEEASRRATAAAVALAAAGSTAAAGAAAASAAASSDGSSSSSGEATVMAPVIAAVVDAGIGGAVPGRAKHGADRSTWTMND